MAWTASFLIDSTTKNTGIVTAIWNVGTSSEFTYSDRLIDPDAAAISAFVASAKAAQQADATRDSTGSALAATIQTALNS